MKKKKLFACALACLLACPIGTASVSATAETWATNFKGIITERKGNYDYKSYYINSNEWLIGDNVALPKYSSEKEKDYIRFLDSSNRSLFGPRVRYEDFVCRFTVIMDNIELAGSGASLGLSFNRKTLYSYANDCAGVLFMKSDSGTAVRCTQGNIDKAESGTIWLQYQEENAIDLWAKKDGKYDFMVVKSGDRAQLYYAEAGDTEGLKTLRATVSGVGGEGLIAVCGIMGANFHLDNFGVWDLNEADIQNGYTVYGSSAVCDGKAVVGHGGGLVSKTAYADASVSYSIKLTGGQSFALTVGEASIHFGADGKVTGSKELAMEQNTPFDFSAFKTGASVRLRKMGAKLYVDLDTGAGYTQCAVFAMIEAKEETVGLRAGADASLIVDTVSAVSLAGTTDIATRDYDPKVDLEPIRPKDKSFEEYYGGAQ